MYFIFHPFLTDLDFLQFYFSKMPYKVCNLERKNTQIDVVKLFNYVWVNMGVKAKEAILMYFILGFFFNLTMVINQLDVHRFYIYMNPFISYKNCSQLYRN